MLTAPITVLAKALDERVNLKRVHRKLQAVARVMIVITFLEDALRCLLTFSVQQQSMRIAGWQGEFWHTALPCASVAVQSSGSLLIALPISTSSSWHGRSGCFILLGWCCFHPFMYHQQTNWEFVLETCTIIGGLLILLSHYMLLAAAAAAASRLLDGKRITLLPAKAVGPVVAEDDPLGKRAHATQAVGRVLICAVFIYYAFGRVHGYVARSLSELGNADVLTPIAQGASIIALLYACSLLIVGIKSRGVALLLALAMLLLAAYNHPFWWYLTCVHPAGRTRPLQRPPHANFVKTSSQLRQNLLTAPSKPPHSSVKTSSQLDQPHALRRGRYLRTDRTFKMEGVAYMEGFEVDAFTMADHQRYFFFQSVSTVGALLLLVVHGPGRLSMDEQQGKLVLITTHDA